MQFSPFPPSPTLIYFLFPPLEVCLIYVFAGYIINHSNYFTFTGKKDIIKNKKLSIIKTSHYWVSKNKTPPPFWSSSRGAETRNPPSLYRNFFCSSAFWPPKIFCLPVSWIKSWCKSPARQTCGSGFIRICILLVYTVHRDNHLPVDKENGKEFSFWPNKIQGWLNICNVCSNWTHIEKSTFSLAW